MKNLIRAFAVSVLVLPFLASAQSTASADIAAQAQALLNQIMQLQQQLGGGGTSATSGVCYTGGTVKPGSSGGSVTALQQFLAADPSIYPEGTVSGFYGKLTQAAVGRWQARAGIVSSGSPSTNGFGSVGPRTAAAMKASCGGGGGGTNEPTVSGFIKVSPTSGMPPLHVNVEATINTAKSCLPATYTLSWGDGSQPLTINIPANKCDVLAQTYSHTYSMGGEFTITLSSGEHQTTSVITVSGNGTMGANGTFETSTNTGGSSTGGTNSGSATGGTLSIGMTRSAYTPASVTVQSGTRITWTNTDSVAHTVTADNSSYSSGSLSPGQTYSLTFTAKGEYTYFCGYHGGPGGVGMSGKIIVQ